VFKENLKPMMVIAEKVALLLTQAHLRVIPARDSTRISNHSFGTSWKRCLQADI
jgi:hypothetical protein